MISTLANIDCHGRSDVGRKRESNQDCFLIADLQRRLLVSESNLDDELSDRIVAEKPGKLFVVADGLGGHAGGLTASSLAVQTVSDHVLNSMHRFVKLAGERDQEFRDELAASVERCQRNITREQELRPELAGMATTLTFAYLVWPWMYLVHVGDTRCYLLRDGNLRQLTTDHTVAQQFIDGGTMNKEDASQSRWRHVIWNCLGGNDHKVAPDVCRHDLHRGDAILLCSDGLTDQVSTAELKLILSSDLPACVLTEQLIDVANLRGGEDNVTAIVAKFDDLPDRNHRGHLASCDQTMSSVAPNVAGAKFDRSGIIGRESESNLA